VRRRERKKIASYLYRTFILTEEETRHQGLPRVNRSNHKISQKESLLLLRCCSASSRASKRTAASCALELLLGTKNTEKLKDTDLHGTLRTTKNEKRGGKGGRKGGGKNRGKLGGGSPNGPSYGPNFGWVLAAVGCVVVVPILVPA
jgi:hypothetical protein